MGKNKAKTAVLVAVEAKPEVEIRGIGFEMSDLNYIQSPGSNSLAAMHPTPFMHMA